jgi:hypothetical protein
MMENDSIEIQSNLKHQIREMAIAEPWPYLTIYTEPSMKKWRLHFRLEQLPIAANSTVLVHLKDGERRR